MSLHRPGKAGGSLGTAESLAPLPCSVGAGDETAALLYSCLLSWLYFNFPVMSIHQFLYLGFPEF